MHTTTHGATVPAAAYWLAALSLAGMTIAGAGCRTRPYPLPEEVREAAEGVEPAAAPPPGTPIPIEPRTIEVPGALNLAGPEEDAPTPPPAVARPTVLYGQVAETGPFGPEDVGEGQWLLLNAVSGMYYVLIPGQLSVEAAGLNINDGDEIRVEGFWAVDNGRRYLRARSITAAGSGTSY